MKECGQGNTGRGGETQGIRDKNCTVRGTGPRRRQLAQLQRVGGWAVAGLLTWPCQARRLRRWR